MKNWLMLLLLNTIKEDMLAEVMRRIREIKTAKGLVDFVTSYEMGQKNEDRLFLKKSLAWANRGTNCRSGKDSTRRHRYT